MLPPFLPPRSSCCHRIAVFLALAVIPRAELSNVFVGVRVGGKGLVIATLLEHLAIIVPLIGTLVDVHFHRMCCQHLLPFQQGPVLGQFRQARQAPDGDHRDLGSCSRLKLVGWPSCFAVCLLTGQDVRIQQREHLAWIVDAPLHHLRVSNCGGRQRRAPKASSIDARKLAADPCSPIPVREETHHFPCTEELVYLWVRFETQDFDEMLSCDTFR
mmetsp:Transcript_10400/g.25064  ORF Transcript_10400/g.25064 Transcript_10400/m.25064 type:complete len:215 (+) Transcript_10400:124-768(+)